MKSKFKWLIPLLLIGTSVLAGVDIFLITNATIHFGEHTTADKTLIFDNNAGVGNPVIRMHNGVLEFSNDGVTFFPISAGVPSGTMTEWGDTLAPPTWDLCNGTSYAVSTRLGEYGAIGTNFGSTDAVHPTGTLVGTSTVNVSSCVGVTAGFYIVEAARYVPLGTTVVSCIGTTLVMSAAASNSTTEALTIAGHFNVPKFAGLSPRGWDPGGTVDPDTAGRTANNAGGNVTTGLGSQQADAFQNHVHSIPGQINVAFSGNPSGAIGAITVFNNTTLNTNGAVSGNVSSETRGKNLAVNFIIKQ